MPRVGALAAFVAYLALLVGFLLIGQPAQYQAVIPGLWFTEAMTIALPAVFTLLVLGVALAPYLGFRRLSWKAALIAVAAAAANQPIVSFLTWMSRLALPADWVAKFDAQQRAINQIFEVHGAAFALTVTIAAPLGEEIFFRGFAFPAVSKSWGLPAAIVVSGAAFSFIHLDAVGFLGLMEIGILLAALRLWSGSIWAAIIGHAVNNGIAGGAFMLGMQDPDEEPPGWVIAVGAVLLLTAIHALVRLVRQPRSLAAEEQPARRRTGATWSLAVFWTASAIWGARFWLRLLGH